MNKEKIIDYLKDISLTLDFIIPNLDMCFNAMNCLLLGGNRTSLEPNEKEALEELFNIISNDLEKIYWIINDGDYKYGIDGIIEILKSLDKTEVNKIGN
ncbi:MAG: hypothetical protein DBY38_12220 [Clostridium cadaveris]|uniref:Uncharacterized protein n=1 Tax=Clostridium cadaveris TaxID=1529 RepID=A0A316M490_9CLOT|nr:MAG: hypothetical protein DBY38_12220 [Clostridium cadaveris]